MGYFSFPHTRTYDSDLGWLIKHLKGIDEKLDEYLENSVITFADPIQWDITEQYTALTMVIDSDGTAYLSKQPVPSGVDISNTDYWMPIFNYDDNINELRSQIAYNARTSATTEVDLSVNDLVFWNGEIYTVITHMSAGSAFIENVNVKPYTVDQKINDQAAAITAITNDVATLQSDMTTAQGDITNIQGDITTIQGDITNIQGDITTIQGDIVRIDSEIDNLKKNIYYNVLDYGAVGDGVNDDTAAFAAAISDAAAAHGTVFIPATANFYIINSELYLPGNIYVLGEGKGGSPVIKFNSANLFRIANQYGGIENLTMISASGAGNAIYFDTTAHPVYVWRFKHLFIEDCIHAFYDTNRNQTQMYTVDIIFEDICCRKTKGTQFLSYRSRGFMTFRDCRVDQTLNSVTAAPWISFDFRDFVGIVMHDCDTVGPVGAGAYSNDQISFRFMGLTNSGNVGNGISSVWLNNCQADVSAGRAFVFQDINYLHLENISVFGCAGTAMTLLRVNYSILDNIWLSGAYGLGYGYSENSLQIFQCTKSQLSNIWINNVNGIGLYFENSSDILISGLTCSECNTGISCNATNTNILIANAIIRACRAYQLFIVSTTTTIANYLVNGAFTDFKTGEQYV